MAFPTIPTGARILSVLATAPSGTHTSPNQSSLTKNAGDLLLAIVVIYDGNSTNAEFSAWGGGFTELPTGGDNAGTATMGIGVAYKKSTGAETGTFTVTTADASTNDSAFFLLSIPGWYTATAPEAGGFNTGTTTAANAGSFGPSWGAEDNLFIAVGGNGETGTGGNFDGITAAPANYTDYAESGISADAIGGVEGAVAFRQLNAATDNPAAFSLDVSNARSSALVVVVRGALTISPTPLTADTVILETQPSSFTADSVVFRTQTAGFAIDAFVAVTSETSISAEAVIRREIAAVFNAEAVISKTQSAGVAADAVVSLLRSATFTGNAVLRTAASAAFTANAVQLKTTTAGFNADAVLRTGRLDGYTAAAALLSPRASSFSTDASIFVLGAGASAFDADAILHREQTTSLGADAFIAATRSDDFTADASLFASRSATFTADATLAIFIVHADDFSADAWMALLHYDSIVVTMTAPAIAGTMTTEATRRSASFSANAVIEE